MLIALLLFCRFTVAAAFVTSSVAKARHVERFTGTLTAFGVPSRACPVVARLVIASEFGVAFCTVAGGYLIVVGLVLATLLLMTFSVAIYRLLRSDELARCNCFGGRSEAVQAVHLYRNGGFMLSALTGLAVIVWSPTALIMAGPDVGVWVVCCLGAVVFAGALINLPEIFRLI